MTPRGDLPPLDGTAWVLSALPGRGDVGKPPPTVRFAHGRATGSDGCNRFLAPYTVKDGVLDVPARAATTRMACPPGQMEQAQAFLGALTGARSYRIDAGMLQLLGADGSLRATLLAQSQKLAGTSWRATAIDDGRGAVVSLIDGSALTLAFGSDGRASGSAGCNGFTARYQSDGSRLKFTAPATTRKMCAQPAGLMEQEAAFVKALQSVATAHVEGDRLELRTAEDALAMILARQGR